VQHAALAGALEGDAVGPAGALGPTSGSGYRTTVAALPAGRGSIEPIR
jgi:hypothetical protein